MPSLILGTLKFIRNPRTDLAYKNLVEQADYSNLQDSSVFFTYEDHYARMIAPIRQSFNALALALLNEGKPAMAAQVLAEATDKLYGNHLRASYTNVQAADILQALNKDEDADRLARAAFEYYFGRVQTDLESGNPPDDIERYLLRQSAQLLGQSGNPMHLEKIKAF